jgi:lipoprotein-anchoring transpeptidase ErfK/SrfK
MLRSLVPVVLAGAMIGGPAAAFEYSPYEAHQRSYGYAPDNYYEPAPGYSYRGRSPRRYYPDQDLNDSAGGGSTRESVADPTGAGGGTITIDTHSRHLYLSLGGGRALRYGIGVGRKGFEWSGTARIGRRAEWPEWIPPAEMLKRRPDLPVRMQGGLDNPLGARALYLYQGNKDTLFRIHGTNEPDTIGHAVSSGCIRMLNGDVVDLYNRVQVGTTVVVR